MLAVSDKDWGFNDGKIYLFPIGKYLKDSVYASVNGEEGNIADDGELGLTLLSTGDIANIGKSSLMAGCVPLTDSIGAGALCCYLGDSTLGTKCD